VHRQLLIDNGIGVQGVKNEQGEAATLGSGDDIAVAPHRVLIFCQLKSMLDLIENSLFAIHLPSVSYMRMDGTTPANKRHAVVQTFNADPSIDVLLLTTHVGGLGLNLTGADTVIFVEHDWNPMRDLQAMDRAHRLGQKRIVNVYRLITKGTLEEKIMGLQRFKMNIASSVVSQQNADLSTMDTENVLDLLAGPEETDSGGKARKEGKLTQKELLESLQDLDNAEDDYRELGDASQFAGSLA
jgi:TATA-binding protein-associated factor